MPGNEPEKKDMSYNERADGYGVGPPESENKELPYEKKREAQKDAEAPTRDENGLPNQHGEMDQYTFRDN